MAKKTTETKNPGKILMAALAIIIILAMILSTIRF
mgnify:CR=1 FL=1|jgi:hypothetical protein